MRIKGTKIPEKENFRQESWLSRAAVTFRTVSNSRHGKKAKNVIMLSEKLGEGGCLETSSPDIDPVDLGSPQEQRFLSIKPNSEAMQNGS